MTFEQLLKVLHQKKADLTQRIAAIEKDFKKGRSADFAEQTTERENDEVLTEIRYEAKSELTLVHNAILQIEQGNYGRCVHCENIIHPERLLAIPYTTTCIKCAP